MNDSVNKDMLEMSDEDIMNMSDAPEMPETSEEEPTVEETAPEEQTESAPEEAVEEDGDNTDLNASDDDDLEEEGDDTSSEPEKEAEEASGGNAGVKEQQDAEDGSDTKAETSETEAKATVDYEAEYNKIMATFKANGRDVKLESPEEAIQLMQMGANYTKKMQALQPNLKLLRMLENNKLLDEAKISNLIDLDKKNPKAIHKLVKDSGVDPMDIDTDAESDYKPGNYNISDEEVAFTSTIEEVSGLPGGREIIKTITSDWDDKSKDMLWKEPNVLRVMTDHKENGIYDRIASEMERRKVLGSLGNVPFLTAYQTVGKELQQTGALQLAPETPSKAETVPEPQPSKIVETRAATPRKTDNSDKQARATSPMKASPNKVKKDYNPLAMSDEEFEKTGAMSNRL
jgi:hypothetical protein